MSQPILRYFAREMYFFYWECNVFRYSFEVDFTGAAYCLEMAIIERVHHMFFVNFISFWDILFVTPIQKRFYQYANARKVSLYVILLTSIRHKRVKAMGFNHFASSMRSGSCQTCLLADLIKQ